jgi:hypothetical protein
MKRSKLVTVLAATCALVATISTTAFAEEEKKEERHTRGIYGGAGLGPAFHQGGDTQLAWRFMAWVRPIKYLSLEAGYFNLRDNNDGDKVDGFALSGVPTYPIGPFDIYAKIGFAVSTINGNTELDPTFGAGGGYQWKRLGGRLEYERFQFDQTADVVWFMLYYQLGEI